MKTGWWVFFGGRLGKEVHKTKGVKGGEECKTFAIFHHVPCHHVIPTTFKRCGVRILGTSVEAIDACEDRKKFSRLCDTWIGAYLSQCFVVLLFVYM